MELKRYTRSKILGILFFFYFSSINAQSIIEKGGASTLPIKPDRTISFTTDEGSYMNVDISPDGKTILFDLLGDIYSIPSTGGKAKQLSRGLALNAYPVWSPDGKYFAYCSDATGSYQVHVQEYVGSYNTVLTSMPPEDVYDDIPVEPRWALDSKNVIVFKSIYHLVGAKAAASEISMNQIGLSKDKNCVYYTCGEKDYSTYTDLSTPKYIGVDYTSKYISICRYNLTSYTTDTLIRIKKTKSSWICNFRISPDGHWLTYMVGEVSAENEHLKTLSIVNLQNGENRVLVNIDLPFTEWLSKSHYSFSPDSKALYIGYKGKIRRIDLQTARSEIIPFTAYVKIDAGPLNHNRYNVGLDSFKVQYCRDISIRPDKKQLVFTALARIYIKDLPNGKPRPLIEQDASQFTPTYSPDGSWIAYVTWDDSLGGQLWRIPSIGGNPEQISKIPGLYIHPSWSPDSKSIVVAKGPLSTPRTKGDPGSGEIQVINIPDGSMQVIADSLPLFNNPIFSSDGKNIIYRVRKDPNKRNEPLPQLVAKSLYGREVVTLATGSRLSEFMTIRQIKVSDDYRYIVYCFSENLYLVPVVNGEFPVVISAASQRLPVIRFAEGGIDPQWEEGGKIIGWTFGNKYFRVAVEKIISNAIKIAAQSQTSKKNHPEIIAPVQPDEVISLDVEAPSFHGKGIIALKNVRIITMKGKEIIESGTIIIKNGRMTSLGANNKIVVPVGSHIIDLKGKTIMPGLIDMHGHMNVGPPDVFPQQSWEPISNLAYGVTTDRDPSGYFDVFGYTELLRTGQMIGPRLFTVAAPVRPDMNYKISDLYEAMVIVRNRSFIGGKDVKQYDQKTRMARQLLLLACRGQKVNMTNETIQHPLGFIGMLKDGSTGVEHNPEYEDARNDMISFLAKSGTYFTPCFAASYQGERAIHYFHALFRKQPDTRLARFIPDEIIRSYLKDKEPSNMTHPDAVYLSKIDSAIFRKGGNVVAGSHGNDIGTGIHEEMLMLQMGGLTPHEVLQCATINGAKALGMQRDLGSIEVGKIADLIILDKNPLEDIHYTTSIKYVMKDGVLYDGETMDQIWPVYKKLTNKGLSKFK